MINTYKEIEQLFVKKDKIIFYFVGKNNKKYGVVANKVDNKPSWRLFIEEGKGNNGKVYDSGITKRMTKQEFKENILFFTLKKFGFKDKQEKKIEKLDLDLDLEKVTKIEEYSYGKGKKKKYGGITVSLLPDIKKYYTFLKKMPVKELIQKIKEKDKKVSNKVSQLMDWGNDMEVNLRVLKEEMEKIGIEKKYQEEKEEYPKIRSSIIYDFDQICQTHESLEAHSIDEILEYYSEEKLLDIISLAEYYYKKMERRYNKRIEFMENYK